MRPYFCLVYSPCSPENLNNCIMCIYVHKCMCIGIYVSRYIHTYMHIHVFLFFLTFATYELAFLRRCKALTP